MRIVVFLSLTLLWIYPAQSKTISFPDGLTPGHAQELIASDLAKEYLSSLEKDGNFLNDVRVGIVDSNFNIKALNPLQIDHGLMDSLTKLRKDFEENNPFFSKDGGYHGHSVANLITGANDISVGYKSTYISSLASRWFGNKATEVNHNGQSLSGFFGFDNILNDNPDLLNISLLITNDDRYGLGAFIKSASEQQVIPVISAGNYPQLAEHYQNTFLHQAIVVGNLDSEGNHAEKTSFGPAVVIAAPAGVRVQLTLNEKGDPSLFGATSGATPMVTGAIANAFSILRRMTLEQTKIFLRKTAVPTRSGQISVNSYKMVRVAKRLQSMGWVKLSKPEQLKLLQTNKLYDFNDEVLKLIENVNDTDTKRLNLFRKAYFLSPTKSLGRVVSLLYQNMGHHLMASFFHF